MDEAMGARLAVLALGLVIFSVLHSVLAGDRVRERGERALGGARAYRLIYSLGSALLLAALHVATRGPYPIVWRATGLARVALLVVQVVAAVGLLHTVRSFRLGEFFGLRAAGSEPRGAANRMIGLVGSGFQSSGIYERCRHPLYFFTALFFSAWPTMDLRALVIAIWLWAYAYVGSFFEERKLVARLGEAYVSYQARTPRLLPFGRRRSGV